MSKTREEFLGAIENQNWEDFLNYIEKNNSKDDEFDLTELIQSLQRKNLEEIWEHLHSKCSEILLNFGTMADLADEKEMDMCTRILQSAVTIATIMISNQTVVPQYMLETVALLNGVLLSFADDYDLLKNSVAVLCETWWKENLPDREELIPQTLVYLLQRSLRPKAIIADVKRVWKVRESLYLINFDDERSETLKQLLLLAVTSTSFLKVDEGRKFLSFCFTLRVRLSSDLHHSLKMLISASTKTVLDWIGQVYFRAWKDAAGASSDVYENVETGCIQDLMFCAVHAPRTGSSHSVSACFHRVLAYFHKQKKQKEVDEMLLRLYEPILWRSHKVANGDVRANAASLLIDAFPFQNPSVDMEENDELLQKQIDVLLSLLEDPNPLVRTVTTSGVFSILNNFWELIPPEKIKSFVALFVQKLAWDVSSSNVRLSVVHGFTLLIDNYLAHSLLQSILPSLCNLFHDVTERVRLAMADMLLKVKGLKELKFWSVVPVDHILARMEIDDTAMVRKLVKLLINSYMPINLPLSVQLERCKHFWRNNPKAARNFYLHAYTQLDAVSTNKFLLFVLLSLFTAAKNAQPNDSVDSLNATDVEPDLLESFEEEIEKDNESRDATKSKSSAASTSESSAPAATFDLQLDDVMLISGLVETVFLLMVGVEPASSKPEHASLNKFTKSRIVGMLPVLLRTFQHPTITAPLIMIAGLLPPTSLPMISCSLLSKLRSLPDDSTEGDYGGLLGTICKWKRSSDVLDLILDWLQPFQKKLDESQRRTSGREVRFTEPVRAARPVLALKYLESLTCQAMCREIILEQNRQRLRNISDCLGGVISHIDTRLQSDGGIDDVMTDELLVLAFGRYLRLEVLLGAEKPSDVVEVLEKVTTWASDRLVGIFKSVKPNDANDKKRARRLLAAADCSQLIDLTEVMSQTMLSQTMLSTTILPDNSSRADCKEFAKSVIESLLHTMKNVLMIGAFDIELVSHLGELCLALLQTDDGVTFLLPMAPLLYQMVEISEVEIAQEEGLGHHEDPMPEILRQIITVLQVFSQTKKSQAPQVLNGLRRGIGDIFALYYRTNSSPNKTVSTNLMASVSTTVVTDVVHAINQVHLTCACQVEDNSLEELTSIQTLPPLSAFLLGMIVHKNKIMSLFLDQLTHVCRSSIASSLDGLAACTFILQALGSAKCKSENLQNCVTLLSSKLAAYSLSEDLNEDSPLRHLHSKVKDILQTCQTGLQRPSTTEVEPHEQ